MAQAKVTIEALTQMANILRQSADDILVTKEQMDGELYSIPWDDPIGLNFISKYEEDFKPLKEKLIPNIESYIQYMQNEGMIVSEYSGESAGGLGVGGVVGVGAMGVGVGIAGATSSMTRGTTSAGLSGMRASSPIAQDKQTKEIGKGEPLIPVEEMDMDAVYAELSPGQKAAYDKSKKEILEQREYELFKAEDMENMGKEMGQDNAKFSGAFYTIRTGHIKEKAIAKSEEELTKLDELAREAVRNKRKPKIDLYLKTNKDGAISWDDKRFKCLEKENAAYLESEEGKLMQKRAKTAFSKINDLSTLTYEQLHQVVGGTLGLKEGEIKYKIREKDSPNTLGWHPWNSQEAILNANQRATMPMCEQIATFAHEGRHVYQDMVINSDSKTDYAIDMRAARASYAQDRKTFEGYYNNDLEKDARKMEIIVGKMCTERHNELIQMKLSKPRRWNPSDYYQK